MTRQELGALIKSERTERGLSIYRVCKLANFSIKEDQVKAIEEGTKNCTIDSLLAVANAIGVDLSFDTQKDAELIFTPPKGRAKKSKIKIGSKKIISISPVPEKFDAPFSNGMLTTNDPELILELQPSPINKDSVKITLKEIKDSCDPALKGLERTQWINEQKAMYGL